MKVILFGRRGKVGSVLAPALEAAGYELVESTHDADVAEIAAELLRLDRLSAAGIGPSEARFRAAIERVNPALVERAAA